MTIYYQKGSSKRDQIRHGHQGKGQILSKEMIICNLKESSLKGRMQNGPLEKEQILLEEKTTSCLKVNSIRDRIRLGLQEKGRTLLKEMTISNQREIFQSVRILRGLLVRELILCVGMITCILKETLLKDLTKNGLQEKEQIL